jgi:uncharacterized membrane protein
VINEDLPPLFEKYEGQINIIGIDVSQEAGQALYFATIEKYEIPESRYGVPALIVGETVLVGSQEIPEFLPGIIEEGLAKGGIDWPDIPGLKEILAYQGISTDSSESENTSQGNQSSVSEDPSSLESSEQSSDGGTTSNENSTEQSTEGTTNPSSDSTDQITNPPTLEESLSSTGSRTLISDRFNRDKTGNTVSVITLLGMIASVMGVGYGFVKEADWKMFKWPDWSIPVLVIIGLVIALYLSYVELTLSDAVCGPVGDCNTVQESTYAHLFGIIPVGVLGVVGYLSILIAWIIQKNGPETWKKVSIIAIWSTAWVGVLFSIYLTFLEPFVIGATCMWCIASAIIMTLILWASTEPVIEIWKLISEPDDIEDSTEEKSESQINTNVSFD